MSAAIDKRGAASCTSMTYLAALQQAQIEELERDERVIMMGEDLAVYGDGKVVAQFPNRIWSTPISETGFTGVAIGAAMTGLRPIVALNIASFMYLAADPIVNQAAKLRYMTGGQIQVPIVFRCSMFYGQSIGAQHSDRPYPLFMNIPGLKIICPTNPADVKGLLKSAVRDDDPVMFFEDSKLWPAKGEVPNDPHYLVPIGKAEVKRQGSDLTLIAIAAAMKPALEAAQELADAGISAEVIDLRTLKPIDFDTILASVAKTGRLVIVENAHRLCSVAGEISATVAEEGFQYLKRPVARLTAPDVHVPFSPALEELMYPTKKQIIAAVSRVLE